MKARTDAEHAAKMKKIQAAQNKKVAAKTVEKGLVIVHTGPGKGKTSAALGMAIRAIGHDMKVGVVQFVKGAMTTGEKAVFDRFPDLIEFKPMGEGFTWDTQDRTRDIAVAREAWEEVKRMIADPSYAMVIADELNIVLRYDYLPVDEVLEAIAAKPHMTHVIITGRNAPQPLIDAADLVTEMAQVKHPLRSQ
jgi:cob(I)alamin adenosyltransferase